MESSAYRLKLPASMKIHTVFYVTLLELRVNDPYPGQIQSAAPPVVVDSLENYEMEEILNSSIR